MNDYGVRKTGDEGERMGEQEDAGAKCQEAVMSEMRAFLEEKTVDEKSIWKRRLLEWGGALDLCSRKHEEIRKLLRLQEESRSLMGKKLPIMGLIDIGMCYENEIVRLHGVIERILQEKALMDKLIEKMSAEEQHFIGLRYEKGYGYDYISLKLHQSRANCFRMQDRILKKLMEQEINVETI